MYSTLLYASIRQPNCDDNEIKKILKSAKKNNPSKDITGVLLYTKNKFLQYLEGDHETLLELYHKIKEDDRHKKVVLVASDKNAIEERLFPSWAMGEKNVDDGFFDIKTIDSEHANLFEQALNGEQIERGKTFDLIRTILR